MPQINFTNFTGAAIVESFEAIAPNTNTSDNFFLGNGFLLPGKNTSYTFSSGASLVSPIPNRSDTGINVTDIRKGKRV
jgi:hypothetical protein